MPHVPIGKLAEQYLGKPLDKYVGKPLKWSAQHPFQAFMAAGGVGMRPLQAAELGQNPLQAMLHPGMEDQLEAGLRQPFTPKPQDALNPLALMRGVGAQIGALEQGPLAGSDLPHKAARGTLDTAYDVVNDPVTYIPGGAIVKGGKLLGLGKPAVKMAEMLEKGPLGKVFHAEHPIAGYTDHGRALILSAMNLAKEKSQQVVEAAEKLIRDDADAIRKGTSTLPEQLGVPGERNPMKVIEAAREYQKGKTTKWVEQNLRASGLLPSKSKKAPQLAPELIYKDPTNEQAIKAAQKGLAEFIKPDAQSQRTLFKLARGATHLGNQAFLAVPVPHAFNLADLSRMRYGLPTMAKGIANAIKVGTGNIDPALAEKIKTLEETGAKSQYGKLFTEVGFGGPLGKAVNTVAIPFQRASNWAQHAVLNNMETGLRAAALDAEAKMGRTGVDAARSIHATFGTNPANDLVKGASEIGEPFAKFHFQTVVGSTLRTLVDNPKRITNMVKAQIDMNRQVNPGNTQFTPTTPSFSGVRAMMSPLSYAGGLTGPLGALYSGYGALTQAEQAKVGKALGTALGRFIPASQVTTVLYRILTGQKGDAGEDPTADLLPILTGGYYSKKKP